MTKLTSKILLVISSTLLSFSILFSPYINENLSLILIIVFLYSFLYSFFSLMSNKAGVKSLGPSESYRNYLEEDMHNTPAYTRRKPTDFTKQKPYNQIK